LHIHRAAALLENAQTTLRQVHPDLTRFTPPEISVAAASWSVSWPWWRKHPRLKTGQAVLRGGGALSVHLTDKAHYGAAVLFATDRKRTWKRSRHLPGNAA